MTSERTVHSTTDSPIPTDKLITYMRNMLVKLDGLWFLHVLQRLGAKEAMEMDIRVMAAQFKKATRLWRDLLGLDGESREDKAAVFQAMSSLYGHDFEVFSRGDRVTMRVKRCVFYENLKAAGRAGEHDCRELCRNLAPHWFAEIEPRTGGRGDVDLQLPVGGDHCDWTVEQPAEDEAAAG